MLTHFFQKPGQVKIAVLCLLSWAAGMRAPEQASDSPAPCSYCARTEAFMKLPPEERVRIWFRDTSKATSATGLSANDDMKVLTSLGLDTVPALAKIVRTGNSNQQIDAVSLLCDMDRFVPMAELPAPEPFGHLGPYLGYNYKGPFMGQTYDHYTGELNPYLVADGRRIGPQGLEAVQWAARQTNNKKLRTFARNCSGLVSEDLRQLSTIDLLAAWRKGVITGHGFWINLDNQFLPVADGILIQRADESIPLLAKIALEDKMQEVRLHAREVLLKIDLEKVRLRGSDAGRKAIEALIESA